MSRKQTKESKSPLEKRREEERDKRREEILQSALTLFGEKGYSETTLTEIAKKARLGKATLYYYFPDKESIFWSIYSEEITRYYERTFHNIMDINNPVDITHRYIMDYIEYGYRNTNFLRLIFPLGKNSPIGGEKHHQYMEEVDRKRRPMDTHLHHVLEQSESKVSGNELTEIIWTFLSGLSLKIIQGYSREDAVREANIQLSMLQSKIQGVDA